ncbi:MAG: type II CAAX endopeptidase family protein [Candidatus Thalassarchaeaceae archaeon]|nr:type II CAAX endopeptidase family protein [Candidatus Thalassarchaeaceae archaeon]
MDDKRRALLAIILVGMAPTVSICISFGTDAGMLSHVFYITSKIWIFGLPVLWYLKVDGGTLSWSKPERGGFRFAIGFGLAMSGMMLAAWLLLGKWLDADLLKSAVEPIGLMDKRLYFLGVLYWIFINSILEEYVFRWFIVEKSEQLLGSANAAIVLSALIFVLHHTIALSFFGFPWWANLIASVSLFVGGAIFSWLYIQYRSIWIPYVAHAICDVTVFTVGAIMLF